jgi:type IV fimbrial biogenesis protein FimT
MRKDAPGTARGLSLVELLASLSILAVLLGLALPGFQDVLRRQRTTAALHLVSVQLAQARNTAITRRAPVTLCPSAGDGRCRADPDWSAGWLVYRDPLRRDQPQAAEDILSDVRQPVHASVQVLASAGRLRVRYQPDGRAGGSNLTLRVCSGGTLRGEVIVNNVGRARLRRHEGGPCGG